MAELLISLTLASLLMVALVDSLQGFGHQLGQVQAAEQDFRHEESLVEMARSVRHAWLVDEPSSDVLQTLDAYGDATTYWHEDEALNVKRPDGDEGVLADGVDDLSVDTLSLQRLRPDADLDEYGEWWSETVADVVAASYTVDEVLDVALGFTISTDAPEDVNTVDGVQELVVSAALESIELPIAIAPPITDVPLADEDSTVICHIPPGNETGANTLKVGTAAVPAHVAHGDYVGICVSPPLPDFLDALLVIELHEAVAPDDGRPVGAPLASTSFPVVSLPYATWTWVEAAEFPKGLSGYSVVCHIPPAYPADWHTTAYPTADVGEHLDHGDHLGACGSGKVSDTTPVLVFGPPSGTTTLDLSTFATVIEPGRAYTLVLRVDGRGTVVLRGAGGSSTMTGVAAVNVPGADYEREAWRVQRTLRGTRTFTQTEAIDVVSQVTLTLEPIVGEALLRTASVLGQRAVDNPWLGAVPGELPTLDIAGQ